MNGLNPDVSISITAYKNKVIINISTIINPNLDLYKKFFIFEKKGVKYKSEVTKQTIKYGL